MYAGTTQDTNTGGGNTGVSSDTAKGTVLIAEDDRESREAIAELLELEGYRVIRTANGQEALDSLRADSRPDLIIMDVIMPRVNGFRFRRLQRRDPALASIPVIITTAIGRAAGVEANLILQKPIDVQALLRAVAEFCSSASASLPEPDQSGSAE